MTVRFDDSLPLLAEVVKAEFGAQFLADGIALRDVAGQLTFISPKEVSKKKKAEVTKRLITQLGPYARQDRAFATPDDIGIREILAEPASYVVAFGESRLRVLDRRLVGIDWLRKPRAFAEPPPRFVFASLKGGVGRSTALAVAAADCAAHGKRVLTIDLDMESPGLGAMLLDDATTPEFGLIDALVENGLAPLDREFLTDLIGPSKLSDRRGAIDVIPAFGQRSLRNPAEILAKLARAYNEDVRPDGSVATILDQVSTLVEHYAVNSKYDAIFVDARAGLHETTASAMLGLGAEIYLFGLDERQTFQSLSALFSHLRRLVDPDDRSPEWLDRITLVQGKAPYDVEQRDAFKEKCKKLWTKFFDTKKGDVLESRSVPLPAEPFGNVPWDDDSNVSDADLSDLSPIEPTCLAILDDERFQLFDPAARRDLLSEEIYRTSFSEFLKHIGESLASEPADRNDDT